MHVAAMLCILIIGPQRLGALMMAAPAAVGILIGMMAAFAVADYGAIIMCARLLILTIKKKIILA